MRTVLKRGSVSGSGQSIIAPARNEEDYHDGTADRFFPLHETGGKVFPVAMTVPPGATRVSGTTHVALPGCKVLVTLPVYNEATILKDSVDLILQTLTHSGIDYTLSIAEDGSTDGTMNLIQEIQREHPTILVQSDSQRHGRGWALRRLWSNTKADFYAFSDVDLAADPRYLVEALQIAQGGKGVVTGSRYVPGARVNRPPLRSKVSRIYNTLVRLLFRDGIRDHQCGLKVFSREAVLALLPLSRENSWFWDTEMLILAKARGFEVTEFPVNWVERKARRTEISRLASDVRTHGTGILRLVGDKRFRDGTVARYAAFGEQPVPEPS